MLLTKGFSKKKYTLNFQPFLKQLCEEKLCLEKLAQNNIKGLKQCKINT